MSDVPSQADVDRYRGNRIAYQRLIMAEIERIEQSLKEIERLSAVADGEECEISGGKSGEYYSVGRTAEAFGTLMLDWEFHVRDIRA